MTCAPQSAAKASSTSRKAHAPGAHAAASGSASTTASSKASVSATDFAGPQSEVATVAVGNVEDSAGREPPTAPPLNARRLFEGPEEDTNGPGQRCAPCYKLGFPVCPGPDTDAHSSECVNPGPACEKEEVGRRE